ncbi:MAG: RNA-binding protein [Alphaproteobacteria bacterium]|jgi:hypothetical protein|nr:RNA-binding protein [Alphaproteobacteria bacterium]MDP6812325.1 RNA-binding protein [Alphaproteobacteria bacterium]
MGKAAKSAPERRCIATGDVAPASRLLRFVVDPEGQVVPDLAQKLPGRGIWVGARRDLLDRAVGKRLFARAARMPVTVADDLPGRVEAEMTRRCLGLLGLARRAGELVLGFEKVRSALRGQQLAAVVVASDGSRRERNRLIGRSDEGSDKMALIELFGSTELSLALGRENVVHAGLRSGGLAARLLRESRRLEEFRG